MVTHPPAQFAATRESLRALACYVISPVRKARTGRIGLRPTGDGFGTPAFDDGTRVVVRGGDLGVEPGGGTAPITTLRAAARFLDIELSPDPGVGHDLPPYAPDDDLDIDASSSHWLGTWYAFAAEQLDLLAAQRIEDATISEAQLWPEHFDLAVTVELGSDAANVGFSPGDADSPDPYIYVGPHDLAGLTDSYWNAPFGARLTLDQLVAAADPDALAADFLDTGLRLLTARSRPSR